MKNNFIWRPLLFFYLSGCSVIHYHNSGSIPISFSKKAGHNRTVKIEGKADFYLWGFVPSSYDIFLDEKISGRGYDEFSKLAIFEKTTWSDLFFTVLSLGMYFPRSFTIMGMTAPKEEKEDEMGRVILRKKRVKNL